MGNIRQKLKEEYQIFRIGLIPGLCVLSVIILLRMLGALQPLEWFALDFFLRFRPAEPFDPRIIVVGINEEDLNALGVYPIPDREIAKLLSLLETYNPRVIGLDLNRNLPVFDGYEDLKQVLLLHKNIIAIEKAIRPKVPPPSYLPPEQIGISDAITDSDGRIRRVLLGTPTPEDPQNYKFSLSLRLVEKYLAAEGLTLENGKKDPHAMRFADIELPRFLPNFGGYVSADAGGVQMLLNFRSGFNPFKIISLQDLKAQNFPPSLFKDSIVIIGIKSPAADVIYSSAITENGDGGVINGVEIHAHTSSAIISAVKDKRPLLQTLSDQWEYFWIIIWGLLGILLSRLTLSPWLNLITIAGMAIIIFYISYVQLLQGFWFPLVPVIISFLLNGIILTAFYQYDSKLKLQIRERQSVIDNTFDAIHNGPLQTLAKLLRSAREQENIDNNILVKELDHLNKEIRQIYESIIQNNQKNKLNLYLGDGQEIDLKTPLYELLYEVYHNTMNRDFPNFKTLKVKIRDFEAIDDDKLTLEQKQKLCRFLEEALCNVGKYATNATKISVIYTQQEGFYVLRITDNGQGASKNYEGQGTKQGKNLARQLKGKFERSPLAKKGTLCELTWPVSKSLFRRKKHD